MLQLIPSLLSQQVHTQQELAKTLRCRGDVAAWFRGDHQPVSTCRAISAAMWTWVATSVCALIKAKAKRECTSSTTISRALNASERAVQEWLAHTDTTAVVKIDKIDKKDKKTDKKDTTDNGKTGMEATETEEEKEIPIAPAVVPSLKNHLQQAVAYLGEPPEPQCPKCGKLASELQKGISELRNHVRHCRGPLVLHKDVEQGEWSAHGPEIVETLMQFKTLLGKSEQHRAADIDEGLQEYTKWLNSAALPRETCISVSLGLWRWVSLFVAMKLKDLMTKKGVTRHQIASEFSVSETEVSLWLDYDEARFDEEVNPPPSKLKEVILRLVKWFGKPPEWKCTKCGRQSSEFQDIEP